MTMSLFKKFENFDKFLHFIVGFFISFSLYSTAKHASLALVLTFLLALSKEVYDAYHIKEHTPDFMDLIVTVVGGLFAVVVIAHA